MKKFILLSLFIATSTYAQVGVGSLNERSMYDIGTGLSMNYYDGYVGINIESLHFFRNLDRPFDNAFLKVGMGANVNINPDEGKTYTGFNFLTSIGYLYVQDQYHEKSVLNKFGTGATLDYSLIDTKNHGIGATLYVVVNGFFIGIGGGAVILRDEDATDKITPYVNGSFAIAF